MDVQTLRAPDRVHSNGNRSQILAIPKRSLLQYFGSFFRFESFFPWEIFMVAGREVKGIVLTPVMALTLFLAMFGVTGTVYWRLSDKLQETHDLLIQKNAADTVDQQWTKSEIKRVETQTKINAELYRQAGESYKQIIGFLAGRNGQKLDVPSSLPDPPAGSQ